MAEYKGIHGTKVQDYTTDPDNPIKGQVWYNETTNTLKVEAATTAGAWATAPATNTARRGLGSAGSATSGLIISGADDGTGGRETEVESWNGSVWTEVGDVNTARRILAGTGTSTSALAFGGFIPPQTAVTESWNGSSWTE